MATEQPPHHAAAAAVDDPALAQLLARTPAVLAPGHDF
jgi:hypothetical protein